MAVNKLPARANEPAPGLLYNLNNITAGELAHWIKATTPDRVRAVTLLRQCAAELKYDIVRQLRHHPLMSRAERQSEIGRKAARTRWAKAAGLTVEGQSDG
jgi:hypothetical protein